jgi:hypothetical protein
MFVLQQYILARHIVICRAEVWKESRLIFIKILNYFFNRISNIYIFFHVVWNFFRCLIYDFVTRMFVESFYEHRAKRKMSALSVLRSTIFLRGGGVLS